MGAVLIGGSDAVRHVGAVLGYRRQAQRVRDLRVIVCGGRAFADRALVFTTLDTLERYARHVPGSGIPDCDEVRLTIVQGGAAGADALAREWVAERVSQGHRHACVTFEAAWSTHGRAAGPIRNARMVAEGADACIAFPGGRGTDDCARRCEEAGIDVVRVRVAEARP